MSIKNYKLNLGKHASIEFEAIIHASLQEFVSYRAKKIVAHCNPIAKERLIDYVPFLSPIPKTEKLGLLLVSALPLAFDGYEGDRTPEDLFPAVSIFDWANPAIEQRPKELLEALREVFRSEEAKKFLTDALVMQANFFDEADDSLEDYSRQEIQKLVDHLAPQAILFVGEQADDLEDLASDLHLDGTYTALDGEVGDFQFKLCQIDGVTLEERLFQALSKGA